MKGKDCIHIESGMKGHIIYEMNSYNPPQWGIQWYNTPEYKEFIKPKNQTWLMFWQNKTDIKIIENES
jgi:hypothetical protein